jgi:hypothetical protein
MTTKTTADPRVSPLIRIDDGPRGSRILQLAMETASGSNWAHAQKQLLHPSDASVWIVTQEGTFLLPLTGKLTTATLIALIQAATAGDESRG